MIKRFNETLYYKSSRYHFNFKMFSLIFFVSFLNAGVIFNQTLLNSTMDSNNTLFTFPSFDLSNATSFNATHIHSTPVHTLTVTSTVTSTVYVTTTTANVTSVATDESPATTEKAMPTLFDDDLDSVSANV